MPKTTIPRARVANAEGVRFYTRNCDVAIISKNTRQNLLPHRKTPLKMKSYIQHACPESCTHLLGLPRELRDQVWQYVFDDAETSVDLQPLLTCRQLYHEAKDIAFEETSFLLAHKYLLNETFPDAAILRRALTPARRSLIQVLLIAADDPDAGTIINPHNLLERLYKERIRPHTVHIEYKRRYSLDDDETDEWLDKLWQPKFLLDRKRSSFLTTLYFWMKTPHSVEFILDMYSGEGSDCGLTTVVDDVAKIKRNFVGHNT